MIIRPLNEFVRESVVLALEPSRNCVCSCSYCFATLNSRTQYAGRQKSHEDDSSWERLIGVAYSEAYDPTNFLQWGIRNKLTCGYANTVEPFQNLEQARLALRLCNRHDIPLFIQTKGINWDEVSPLLADMRDNISVFVSIPSLDQRVAGRFEPGTPPISSRLAILEWLADHDIWAIAALSPYHEEWVKDPEELAQSLFSAGADEIFLDRLHLNNRQKPAARDGVMVELASRPWGDKMYQHLFTIHEMCMKAGIDFFAPSFAGTVAGRYNTLPAISPDACFRRGMVWPYNDGRIFRTLESSFYSEGVDPLERDPRDSILFSWSDCLAIMEEGGRVEQPFSYRSLYDLISIGRRLPDEWTKYVGTARPAPITHWFRAMWNTPKKNQFVWRHPWIQVAMRPDGVPWLDGEGNLIALFDPDWPGNGNFRAEPTLEHFRTLDHEPEADSQ